MVMLQVPTKTIFQPRSLKKSSIDIYSWKFQPFFFDKNLLLKLDHHFPGIWNKNNQSLKFHHLFIKSNFSPCFQPHHLNYPAGFFRQVNRSNPPIEGHLQQVLAPVDTETSLISQEIAKPRRKMQQTNCIFFQFSHTPSFWEIRAKSISNNMQKVPKRPRNDNFPSIGFFSFCVVNLALYQIRHLCLIMPLIMM